MLSIYVGAYPLMMLSLSIYVGAYPLMLFALSIYVSGPIMGSHAQYGTYVRLLLRCIETCAED